MFSTESVLAADEGAVVSQGYVIAYPPGVPLVVPGDVLTREVRDEVARLRRAGVEIFFINQ
jgi:arginine/lysine/ornithine decarboxylase